ncbi:MAG: GntR family transcriptional regulator [Pseudomonadota bacterium]
MRTSVVPRYHQIFLVLSEQIREGRFDDARLPTEHELAETFKAGRVTVRRALDGLQQAGLISRTPGLGTFVKKQAEKRKAPASKRNLFENLVALTRSTTVKVLEYKLVRKSDIAQLLGLDAQESVLKIVRVRSFKGTPLSHITTYLPQQFSKFVRREKLLATPMLTLMSEAGVLFDRAEQSISAKLADPIVADRLQMDAAAALLAVRRITYDKNGRAIQYLEGLYRPDLYEYRLELSRTGVESANIWSPSARGENTISGE